MAFLNPFAVDGASIHAAQLRQHLYQTVKGETGVLGPESLKVVGVAGSPGVAGIMPGTGAITVESRREAYQVANPVMDGDALIDVPPAGGGGATWHVIVEVTDPQYHGSEPAVAPRLVPTLAGLTRPYLWLASFTLAAGAGFDVTTPVVDRRRIVMVREHRDLTLFVPASQELTQTVMTDWPSSAAPSLEIPAWATHAAVVATIAGVVASSGNVTGYLRLLLGELAGAEVGYDIDQPVGSAQRYTFMVGWSGPVGVMAGTIQTLRMQGRRTGAGGEPGTIRTLSPTTHLTFDAQFTERPL